MLFQKPAVIQSYMLSINMEKSPTPKLPVVRREASNQQDSLEIKLHLAGFESDSPDQEKHTEEISLGTTE